MTDTPDTRPEPAELAEPERETIREAILAHQEAEHQEKIAAERTRRRQERDERAKQRREQRTARARQARSQRLRALEEANAKVTTHVAAASRSLRSALREASEVPVSRQTAEGREQQRILRSIESAMGALRRVGRGTFHEVDLDVDLDVEAEVG